MRGTALRVFALIVRSRRGVIPRGKWGGSLERLVENDDCSGGSIFNESVEFGWGVGTGTRKVRKVWETSSKGGRVAVTGEYWRSGSVFNGEGMVFIRYIVVVNGFA